MNRAKSVNRVKSKGKGFKICPGCYSNLGVRTKICKVCKYEFPKPQPHLNFKKKRRAKAEKVNWRTLQKGDKIIVKGSSIFEGEEVSHHIVRKGIFIVDKVVRDGIHVYSRKGTGHSYINMTKTGINKLGFLNKPHKVERIISNE